MNKNTPLDKVVATGTGFCEVTLSFKTLSIQKQDDGSASILVTYEGKDIRFIIDPDQIVHLVKLLTQTKTEPR